MEKGINEKGISFINFDINGIKFPRKSHRLVFNYLICLFLLFFMTYENAVILLVLDFILYILFIIDYYIYCEKYDKVYSYYEKKYNVWFGKLSTEEKNILCFPSFEDFCKLNANVKSCEGLSFENFFELKSHIYYKNDNTEKYDKSSLEKDESDLKTLELVDINFPTSPLDYSYLVPSGRLFKKGEKYCINTRDGVKEITVSRGNYQKKVNDYNYYKELPIIDETFISSDDEYIKVKYPSSDKAYTYRAPKGKKFKKGDVVTVINRYGKDNVVVVKGNFSIEDNPAYKFLPIYEDKTIDEDFGNFFGLINTDDIYHSPDNDYNEEYGDNYDDFDENYDDDDDDDFNYYDIENFDEDNRLNDEYDDLLDDVFDNSNNSLEQYEDYEKFLDECDDIDNFYYEYSDRDFYNEPENPED